MMCWTRRKSFRTKSVAIKSRLKNSRKLSIFLKRNKRSTVLMLH